MKTELPRIVLDTNIVLSALSSRSPYHKILDVCISGKYALMLSTEILLEYEEKISQYFSYSLAENLLSALLFLPDTTMITPYFNFNIIRNDPDDNKFVDCAVAANAHYLVTNDKHFGVLAEVPFPSVNVLSRDQFLDWLNNNLR